MGVDATHPTESVICSRRHKPQDRVEKLITSPMQPCVYICDECIDVCHTIIEDQGEVSRRKSSPIGKDLLSTETRSGAPLLTCFN